MPLKKETKPNQTKPNRYVHLNVNVKEEMLDLVAFNETTRGIDVRNALDEIMNRFELLRNKLVRVATDGASAMMGKNLHLNGLFNNDPKIPCFVTT